LWRICRHFSTAPTCLQAASRITLQLFTCILSNGKFCWLHWIPCNWFLNSVIQRRSEFCKFKSLTSQLVECACVCVRVCARARACVCVREAFVERYWRGYGWATRERKLSQCCLVHYRAPRGHAWCQNRVFTSRGPRRTSRDVARPNPINDKINLRNVCVRKTHVLNWDTVTTFHPADWRTLWNVGTGGAGVKALTGDFLNTKQKDLQDAKLDAVCQCRAVCSSAYCITVEAVGMTWAGSVILGWLNIEIIRGISRDLRSCE
jgi:hypothetical protein